MSSGHKIIALALLASSLGGCGGGGGSEGFDIGTENAAIGVALDSGQCLNFETLKICPASNPPATAPSVTTSIGNSININCLQTERDGACTVSLDISPQGFAADSTFKILSRTGRSGGTWVLAPSPVPSSEPSTLASTLVLTPVEGTEPANLQVAILAFPDATASLPEEVAQLHDTKASVAFVTNSLSVDVWTTHGPYEQNVSALVIDPTMPSTLYALTAAGVNKSTNSGGNWHQINTGLPEGYPINALAIDPITPSTLYAATGGGGAGGMFRSTNGGSSWSAINMGLHDNSGNAFTVSALVIDPTMPSTLYAGTDGGGMFRTTDSGGNWHPINTGLPAGYPINALAIDPITPSTLYAGTERGSDGSGGVFRSTDSGGSWSAINMGLPVVGSPIFALAIDPTIPTTLYAAPRAGVFRSTDSGGSWSASSIGLTDNSGKTLTVFALAFDPTTPTTLYAAAGAGGVFRSTDSGGSWSASSAGLTFGYNPQSVRDYGVRALAINPVTPSTLYAGTSWGAFQSSNSGDSWIAANTGLLANPLFVTALAIEPTTSTTLYAGTYGNGVFRSTDAGGSWSPRGLNNSFIVTALAIDPTIPTTLYAGYSSPGDRVRAGGVYKSTNGGSSWSAASTGLSGPYFSSVFALAIDPGTPSRLYAATDAGLFQSTDSGTSWSPSSLNVSWVYTIAIDPRTPTTLYAGTQGVGVFRSMDAGSSWSAINSGMPDNTGLTLSIATLAIDPTAPSTLYAGRIIDQVNGVITNGGAYRSTNGGATWTSASTGLSTNPLSVRALAIDPAAPSTLYAAVDGFLGAEGGVVFRSTNSGASWNPIDTGLPNGGKALAVGILAFAPSTPPAIYALSFGVFSLQQLDTSTTSGGTISHNDM